MGGRKARQHANQNVGKLMAEHSLGPVEAGVAEQPRKKWGRFDVTWAKNSLLKPAGKQYILIKYLYNLD